MLKETFGNCGNKKKKKTGLISDIKDLSRISKQKNCQARLKASNAKQARQRTDNKMAVHVMVVYTRRRKRKVVKKKKK